MPQKQKIAVEEKVRIVRECLSQKISISEAARRAGADFATVKMWICIYENDGVEGFTHQGMKTYTAETKTAAVIEYLRGGGSLQEICRKYNIRDTHILRRWLKVYNAHGDFNSVKHSGGGSYMKQGRDTTKEERLEIVKDCLASGKNYGAVALKYQVSYQQVRTWTLRFEEMGEAGIHSVKDTINQNSRLRYFHI